MSRLFHVYSSSFPKDCCFPLWFYDIFHLHLRRENLIFDSGSVGFKFPKLLFGAFPVAQR